MTPESEEEREAHRRGDPYLVYRDHLSHSRVISLPETWEQAAIGRSLNAEVILSWDPEVSTVHAELVRIASDWFVVDDGLSRNGSFVNGERVAGRRRLRDGDELRCGGTVISFRAPFQVGEETVVAREIPYEPRHPER